jgi:dethiobiotin synthetase
MTASLFIAGTGTDVGKTHVAAGILRAAAARGRAVEATKPVMSGVEEGLLAASDAGVLLSAMGREPTPEAVDAIAPWRFRAALAPTAAARAEGRSLAYAEARDFCRTRLGAPADLHVIESAGGIMSPLADGATCLDLAADLGLSVVLVAAATLGAVSHTLTALAALETRGLLVPAVVVNEAAADAMRADDLIMELAPFTEQSRLFAWRHGQTQADGALLDALGAAD